MESSQFLFDDREYFTFGQICSEVEAGSGEYAALVERARENKNRPSTAFQKFSSIVVGTALSVGVLTSSATPLHWPDALFKGKQIATFDVDKLPLDKGLARSFIQARKFLGLTQNETSQITGIAKSTIEKIDQDIYPVVGNQIAMQMVPVIELWGLFKQHFGEKKFIARSRLNTPDSLLGGVSPLEYARTHGPEGLREIIGLEYKSLG